MNENLKKVVDAAAEFKAKFNLAMADGTFNMPGDLFPFFGLLISLPDLYNSGPAIWEEVKNRTHPDMEELEVYVRSKDFGTDDVETVINNIANAIIANIKAVDSVMKLLKGNGGASDPA